MEEVDLSKSKKMSEAQAKAFIEGVERGKRDRELYDSFEEEAELLKEALFLDKHEEVPKPKVRLKDAKNLQQKYEDRRLLELHDLQDSVHDPSGTRNDIEAGK